MKLGNAEIRPGTVVRVHDASEGMGLVQCAVPGLFSVDDAGLLPVCRPLTFGGSFSQPNIGDDVWVLFFHDNKELLFWWKQTKTAETSSMYQYASTDTSVPTQEKNSEIVLMKDLGGGRIGSMYFSEDSGIKISNCDARIQIDPDENITIESSHPSSKIELDSEGNITMGNPNLATHTIPYGERVEDMFANIISTLNGIADAAMCSPHTRTIADSIRVSISQYDDEAHMLSSNKIKIE